ncbi:radical SAM family heme chaperone HemW [Pseudomonas sp. F1_0610]|uniref:radical SAM family heme chaperone HemW n=1 Tax=Pseudomonas sp. F1_0610 TaxID=3114284 RepID=UPI0039C3F08D
MSGPIHLPPLALYIHIPWCIRKCPYCDFNSHAASQELPESAYVQALLADLAQDLNYVQKRPLGSIFFGGGTPSLFSAQALEQILQAVQQLIPFTDDIEITLEANPGTFEQEKFKAFRKIGINRLSIGMQSFQDEKLIALGRVHNGAEALQAADMARQAGFDNFNLDLMHGLPQQSVEDALYDLQRAIAQKPTHISWYQLTMEPNTVFWSKPPLLPEDEILWDIQEAGQALLAEHGYQQYEISAYAQPQKQAKHNLNYWQFGDFLGIGAGAHAKLTLPNGQIKRLWKTRQPKDYLNATHSYLAGESWLSPQELPFEFLMNALRLTEGVASHSFTERTGLPLSTLAKARAIAEQKQLLNTDPTRLQASAKGHLFLNDLLQIFLE